jgi:hypothetical protein
VIQTGRVYRDKGGELWLDPGDGRLLSLDGQVLRALREKWGTASRDDVEEALGELTELTDGRGLLPPPGRWPLLKCAEGRTMEESAQVALRVAGRARDAEDCLELLEACGLRPYAKGVRA